MIARKPSKVEELLGTLQLYHLLPTTGLTPQSYPVKQIRLAWSAPNQHPAPALHNVKPKFTKPLRRRLRNKYNQSLSSEIPLDTSLLVTVKPDRITPVKKFSLDKELEQRTWTPRVDQKETELETTLPLHKRKGANRTSMTSTKKTRPLQFIHFYRHIQLGSIEPPPNKLSKTCLPRFTPEQVILSSYDPPYSLSLKGKKGRSVGYSQPKVRKVTEEIKRLQLEKDRKFDEIIAGVVKEFDLPGI